MSKDAHITITIGDILATEDKSVRSAILEWCENSYDTASGLIGPSFATSGPGPAGWSKEYDETDFARRLFEEGALYYINEDDGRMISAEEVDEDDIDIDDLPDNVVHDGAGGYARASDWTGYSVVCVACPSIEDALDDPEVVAEMAQSVIDHHSEMSDKAEWKKLIESVNKLHDALEDIDPNDFD